LWRTQACSRNLLTFDFLHDPTDRLLAGNVVVGTAVMALS